MEPDAIVHVLDKYGPMGCALIVICVVLILFVFKVLPLVSEGYSKRLDAVIAQLAQLVTTVGEGLSRIHARLDSHEDRDAKRHEELTRRIDKIDEAKHETENQ